MRFNTVVKAWRKLARPERVTIHGLKLDVSAPEIDREMRREIYRARYQARTVAQLRTKLEPNDVFLDIGAGIGVTSLFAASIVGAENVVAVEPDPRSARIAAANFERNARPIELIEAAAVASDRTTVEFYPNDVLGASSLTPRAGGMDPTTVRAIALPTLLKERRITALHIDAEGAEADLLLGIHDFGNLRIIFVRIRDESIGYDASTRLVTHLFAGGFALDFPQCRGDRLVFARWKNQYSINQ